MQSDSAPPAAPLLAPLHAGEPSSGETDTSAILTLALAAYVGVSLTIPFWVPIVKRLSGDCGVFWVCACKTPMRPRARALTDAACAACDSQVFSVLTYYAYLAWLIFVLLIALLLYRVPPLGVLWVTIVLVRIVQFVRLGARAPAGLSAPAPSDEEAPLPLAPDDAPAAPSAAVVGAVVAAQASPRGAAARGVREATAPSAASTAAAAAAERAANASLGRVLLVGNGPSIRERGVGHAIDSFDTVVRFNSFVTKGFEEHAGSKTTLWCHMMQWYHISTVEVRVASLQHSCRTPAWRRSQLGPEPTALTCERRASRCARVALVVLVRTDRAEGGVAADLLRVESRRARTSHLCAQLPHAHAAASLRHHLDPRHLLARAPHARPQGVLALESRPCRPSPSERRAPRGRICLWRPQLHQVPTTGFVMLMRLLECVDRVHIIGFDGFGIGQELHYYRERSRQIRVNAAGALLHDWAKEQAAIARLIEQGRVVPL